MIDSEKAGSGHDGPVPKNRFVSFLVRHPCVCAWTTLVLAIALSFAGPMAVVSSGSELFSSAGAYDISHETALHQDALALAVDAAYTKQDEDESSDDITPQQTQTADVLFMVFESTGEDVYTEANIKKMREIEQKIITQAQYPEYCKRTSNTSSTTCARPNSPLKVFYSTKSPALSAAELAIFDNSNFDIVLAKYIQMFAIHGPTNALLPAVINALPSVNSSYITDAAVLYLRLFDISTGFTGEGTLQDIPATLRLCRLLHRIPTLKQNVEFFFDNTFVEDGDSKYSRMLISFGAPLAGYKNQNDDRAGQRKKLADWFNSNFRDYLADNKETGSMDVLYFATPLVGEEFQIIILVDLLLAIGSFTFIFLFLWLQTGSVIIAIAGIIEIVLSMPISFTIYRSVFQFKYLAGLNAMVLYIVFAIGADDIFVFMDAFKQSAYEGAEVLKDLETRMTWTYNRAATAMLITSFTTMCAFVATAISPLVEVASFGIFASMVIAVDYILVITFLPSVVVIWHNYFGNKPNLCCACCNKQGCGGLCKKMEETPTETALRKIQEAGGVLEPKKRKAEVFFGGPVADFVLNPKARIATFVVFALLLIPIIILSTQAEPATTPDQFLPSDHPFQRIFDIINNNFPATADDPNTAVYFVWGIDTVNRDGVRLLVDPSDLGTVTWNANFELDGPGQEYIIQMCDLAMGKDFVARTKENALVGKVVCPMKDVKQFVLSRNMTWPIPANEIANVFTAFAAAPGKSITDEPLRGNQTNADVLQRYFGMINGRLAYIAFSADATLRERGFQSAAQIRNEYDHFASFVTEVNAARPAGSKVGAAFQTTVGSLGDVSKWVWMNTQGLYVTSAVTGAVFGTCLAFVVLLLATRNIVVALAATVTIAGILSSVLAFVTALGWKLGTIESVSLTILAGFSVDYVVHLAHAFVHSKSTTRADRTRDAFASMGVSVLSGMISSVGASLMLFVTTLVFFSKFGGFLCSTVVFSWLWANLFFMGVMATVGPEGHEKYLGFVCSRPDGEAPQAIQLTTPASARGGGDGAGAGTSSAVGGV